MATRSGKLFLFLILAVLIGGGGAAAYLFLRDQVPPSMMLTPPLEYVGPGTNFTLEAQDVDSGIRSLRVEVVVNGAPFPLLQRDYADAPRTVLESFSLESLPRNEGGLVVTITIVDASLAHLGAGNTAELSKAYVMDLTPPAIIPRSTMHNVRQGGAACFVFSLSEEARNVGVGLANTDYFFPAFKQASGDWICFFAFPYDMPVDEFQPFVTATDMAGNENDMPVSVHALARTFKQDTLRLPDSFLESKFAEFAAVFPQAGTPLERYLMVNNQLRTDNYERILEITATTAGTPYWTGTFSRLPEAAPRAGFADYRTYYYGEEAVDQQVHLGVDLASVKQAPVPAANAGEVVFADDLGIYGRTLIIDHGMGIHSLYSHLSSFTVSPGTMVARNDVIGHTGMTGLAGGDHLHFAMLVGGVFVTPLEWWDPHWLQDNVMDRFTSVREPEATAEETPQE